MTNFKIKVYEQLRILYNKRLGYTPTKEIASLVGMSYSTTYRALRTLEADGLISRKSYHSGWRPAPLAAATYGTLLSSYRRAHDYISAQTIGIQLNTNDRIIRHEMVKLEEAGIIERCGERGGWKPIRIQPEPTVADKLLRTLHKLYDNSNQPIPTNSLADALNVHPSYARRMLKRYSQKGVIQRAGYFAGWLPHTA